MLDINSRLDPKLVRSASSWLRVDPVSIRKVLSWVKRTYNNPTIYVTENGFSDALGNHDDAMRVYFHKHYINQVLKCGYQNIQALFLALNVFSL